MKICVLVIFDNGIQTMLKELLLLLLIPFLLIPISNVYAEHVLDFDAFAQYLDIAQLESESFIFEFDDVSYSIYYGYSGSMDDSFDEHIEEPIVQNMIINQERKSIEVFFEDVPTKTDFWVRIPFEVLTAEQEKYQVLIDGIDTGYDLMRMPDGYVVGMIIDSDAKHVEIIGTTVIPEFGAYAIMILGLSILGLVYFARKSSFGSTWTRIN